MSELWPEKPPDDRKARFWYYKRKQQYARYHRLYGDSLSGGVDRAKIITVTETENKKKKGKDKKGKVVSYEINHKLHLYF